MRNAGRGTLIVLVSVIFLTLPRGGSATAQGGAGATETGSALPKRWLVRIEPWHGIPQDLALRFGEAAFLAGLTKSEAAKLLNNDRFVAAVGSPDQGWGLLEAMTLDSAAISDAWRILRTRGHLTTSGVTSFQYAFLQERPELRNAYLADLGHMIAVRADGAEVLVDIQTGRQVTGRNSLGVPVTAPGGGLLPSTISPEEAAAQMWAQSGIDPNDPNPAEADAPASEITPAGPGPGPGFNYRTERTDDYPTLAIYLVASAFVLSWVGYAAVMVARRLRRS